MNLHPSREADYKPINISQVVMRVKKKIKQSKGPERDGGGMCGELCLYREVQEGLSLVT